MFGTQLRQFIRGHRRSSVLKALASASEKYLRAFHNEGFYVFDSNGERFAATTLARWAGNKPLLIWDVGAHLGGWSEVAHEIFPKASITSFEILPPIAEKLAARRSAETWFKLEQIGFSDRVGEVEVTWNTKHDTTNSIEPRLGNEFFQDADLVRIPCRVSTIDTYLAEGAPPPDFLKIDVEGHELPVLKGARGLFSGSHAPVMIQFEYGDTWLPGSHTLQSAQAYLEAFGYTVGRLYPDHVAFKNYSYPDDNFRMGNMIAVRDDSLKALLAG
jgi:FkbM family methyltransferase